MFKVKFLIIATLAVGITSEVTYSQILIDPSKPDMVIGIGNVVTDDLSVDLGQFIAVDRLRQSLELSNSQENTLLARMQEIGVQNFQLNQLISDEKDLDKMRERWELIRVNQSAFALFVEKKLLPHQVEIARNLAFENYVSSVELESLISNAFANFLANATDKEKELFDQTAIKIKKELDQKIQELKLEAVKKLIKSVPAKHRGNLPPILELSRDQIENSR